ncbi:MAG: SUMF1/EgtB/PvdO family nonheme iron enzyme [Myxococcota bacterium]|nr:SUMF1/EgtB/PvdO family nonheme iron enzyme [Myxococcota bacterium]
MNNRTSVLQAISQRMIRLPAGNIRLRDDRKKTTWEHELPAFLLSNAPVTQEEFSELMGNNPSCFTGAQHPVESVTWWEAIAYCNALSEAAGLAPCYLVSGEEVRWDREASGYRLPSDAEWEYACRAGGDVRYGELDEIAWFEENADERTHPVMMKLPNPWGLYDMLGNVWEWCWDVYDPEVYGEYRVFRGGGWADRERGCLASNRRRSHPTYQIDDLGFRVARSV